MMFDAQDQLQICVVCVRLMWGLWQAQVSSSIELLLAVQKAVLRASSGQEMTEQEAFDLQKELKSLTVHEDIFEDRRVWEECRELFHHGLLRRTGLEAIVVDKTGRILKPLAEELTSKYEHFIGAQCRHMDWSDKKFFDNVTADDFCFLSDGDFVRLESAARHLEYHDLSTRTMVIHAVQKIMPSCALLVRVKSEGSRESMRITEKTAKWAACLSKGLCLLQTKLASVKNPRALFSQAGGSTNDIECLLQGLCALDLGWLQHEADKLLNSFRDAWVRDTSELADLCASWVPVAWDAELNSQRLCCKSRFCAPSLPRENGWIGSRTQKPG